VWNLLAWKYPARQSRKEVSFISTSQAVEKTINSPDYTD